MSRPTFSEELLDLVERTSDPTIRSKLKIAQEHWDRKRKPGKAKRASPADEPSKRPRKRRFKPYWRD